jgi:hypothetical protein
MFKPPTKCVTLSAIVFAIEVGSLLSLEGGGGGASPCLLKFNARKRVPCNNEDPEKCSRFTTLLVSAR